MLYKTCPHCKSNLDPGETCDCDFGFIPPREPVAYTPRVIAKPKPTPEEITIITANIIRNIEVKSAARAMS